MNFRSLPSYITEPSIDINGIMAQGQEEKPKDIVFQPPNPIPIASGNFLNIHYFNNNS
jgi:hypothetical protein